MKRKFYWNFMLRYTTSIINFVEPFGVHKSGLKPLIGEFFFNPSLKAGVKDTVRTNWTLVLKKKYYKLNLLNFTIFIIFIFSSIFTIAQDTSSFQKFNKKHFDSTIYVIRDSALKALKKAYPQISLISIDISGLNRSLKEQQNNYKNGASTTLLSAHNLGAAADFTIFFNKLLVNPTKGKQDKSILYSFEPYQILGKFILDYGYFWGIPWDPAHCQLIRKTYEIVKKYPEFQENINVQTLYNLLNKSDSIPIKYKPFIEIMDTKFNETKNRIYDEKQHWIEDTLLAPIEVNEGFRSKFRK